MGLYRVVTRLQNGNSLICRLPSRVTAETMKMCIEHFLTPDIIKDVHLVKVGLPLIPPPADYTRAQYGFWCPYCGKSTKRFIWNDYTRCEICWSTNESFEFKTANHTWYKGKGRRIRKTLTKKQKREKALNRMLSKSSTNTNVKLDEKSVKRRERARLRRIRKRLNRE